MPKKINPEVKARAVRLVTEHRQEYPSDTAAAAAVANSWAWAERPCAGGLCRPRSTPAPGPA